MKLTITAALACLMAGLAGCAHLDPHPNDAASAAASPVASPASAASAPATPLSAALPFSLGAQPGASGADGLAALSAGLSPSKAKIVKAWAENLVSDPVIRAYFLNPAAKSGDARTLSLVRAMGLLNGMERISQDDREQLLRISQRAIDNAPADCGGTKNLMVVIARYMSLNAESDAALQAQLNAVSHLLHAAVQTTPATPITPAQRLQGQLAASASISAALKRDPDAADDLALLMSGKQATMSPAAWCRATRVYRGALASTPQPARDWAFLAGLDVQKRVIALLLAMPKPVPVPTPAPAH